MTLEEIIKYCENVADYDCFSDAQRKCSEEHRRIAEWLKEIKENEPDVETEKCSEIPKNCPAADVVPVVHGVWRNGYRVQTCSVCKGTGKKSWKFCPYCGAKMDGERKEEGQNGGND